MFGLVSFECVLISGRPGDSRENVSSKIAFSFTAVHSVY